jgi:antitoxin VapB
MQIAKIFKNGESQAVRLPKEFRFAGKQVFIKKIDNMVVLISMDNPWESLFGGLDKFSKDFMESRQQPKQQKRAKLFI